MGDIKFNYWHQKVIFETIYQRANKLINLTKNLELAILESI